MPKIHTAYITSGAQDGYATETFASLSEEKLLKRVKKAAKAFDVDSEDDEAAWTQSKYNRAVGACKTMIELVNLFSEVHAPYCTDDEPQMGYAVVKD